VVVDDASTDDTIGVLEATRPELGATLQVERNPTNRGHGPSLMSAYRHALAAQPDFVLQVDGDGQFHGSDLRRVLVLLMDEAHAVSGVRRFRQDPWFRMRMTRALRLYLGGRFGVRARDANCPLRGYDAQLLADLIKFVPPDSLIPNLYLTVVAARHGVALLEVDVSHRVRRGQSAVGTMWGRAPRSPIPWRLIRFSLDALQESREFKSQMDLPAWARDQPGKAPADDQIGMPQSGNQRESSASTGRS
jgi:glycosyltransferase involved in cell wall biosynthesis